VYFRACEGPQGSDLELLGEVVDARVLEELGAAVVDAGDGWMSFEFAGAGDFPGEVFACVEVFEEA
jgi:hypothetical protein